MTEALRTYNRARNKLDASSLDVTHVHGASRDLVSMIEARLGVTLPASYRQFLLDYGILEVEGQTIYGEFDDGDFASAVPSFVFATENGRRLGELDVSDIMIGASGDGADWVIDCAVLSKEGEAPVLAQTARWNAQRQAPDFVRHELAPDFGNFFLRFVALLSS